MNFLSSDEETRHELFLVLLTSFTGEQHPNLGVVI